jgi:hypothetical protein
MKLRHELWEDDEGYETFCLAGSRGNAARKLLSPNARLIWTIEAESHFEAMTQYYRFRGWGDYSTDQAWDMLPYPEEWYQAVVS